MGALLLGDVMSDVTYSQWLEMGYTKVLLEQIKGMAGDCPDPGACEAGMICQAAAERLTSAQHADHLPPGHPDRAKAFFASRPMPTTAPVAPLADTIRAIAENVDVTGADGYGSLWQAQPGDPDDQCTTREDGKRMYFAPTTDWIPTSHSSAIDATGAPDTQCTTHGDGECDAQGSCMHAPPAASRVPLTPAQQHADELRSLLSGWVDSFADCIEGGESDEMVVATRAALAKTEASSQEGGAA